MIWPYVKSVALVLLCVCSGYTHARGGIDGGGGDVVILQDNRVVVADPFVKRFIGKGKVKLGPKISNELKVVGRILDSFGTMGSEFIEKQVLNPLIDYREVEQIPDLKACKDRVNVEESSLPYGATVQQIACTSAHKTWIRGDLFRKMNLREQTKIIFHERLRAIGADEETIVELTDMIDLMLELHNKARLGKPRRLTHQEFKKLKEYRKTALLSPLCAIRDNYEKLMDLWNSYKLHQFGGGVVSKHALHNVSNDAFVGPGVIVLANKLNKDKVRIKEGAILHDTNICLRATCVIGKGGKINSVRLLSTGPNNTLITMKSNASLHSSALRWVENLTLEKDSKIKNSIIQSKKVMLGKYSEIKGSHLSLNWQFGQLHLGTSSLLEKVSIKDPLDSWRHLELKTQKDVQLKSIQFKIDKITKLFANEVTVKFYSGLRLNRKGMQSCKDTKLWSGLTYKIKDSDDFQNKICE